MKDHFIEEESLPEVSIYDIKEMEFDKTKVNLTYCLLFYINMSLNLDHGTMPSATKDL
jgi:hypothetical protein